MRLSLLLAVFVSIIVLVAAGGGGGDDWPDDHSVKVLTASNFESSIADAELALVEFYAPWCGHCKRLAPAYQEVAQYFNEENASEKILIGKVDSTQHGDLASKYGVRGYPTIKLFRKGNPEPVNYEGDRSAAAMKRWLQGQAGPAVTFVSDQAQLDALLSKNSLTAVGYFAADSADLKSFTEVANKLREKVRFVNVQDSSLAPADAKVVLHRDFDVPAHFNGDMSGASAWIIRNVVPFWGELTMENARDLMAKKKPLLLVFLSPEELKRAKDIIAPFMPTALANADDFAYAYLNNDTFGQHQNRLGLDGKTPNIAIDDYEEGLKYPYSGDMSAESFAAWVASFKARTLQPHMRSAQPPATNDEPVKVVVGKTWNEIVNDPHKDVMVEIYAPWCGHCKKLEPKYTELAEKLANESSVVVAKMDGTENDPPSSVKVQGFPTLVFFPANNKTGLRYDGGREVDDMYNYIKKNAAIRFKEESTLTSQGDDKKTDL